MNFNYQARTKTGEIHAGQIEASSEEAAVLLLQRHGLYVTFLEENRPAFYAKRIKLFSGIDRKEIVLFSRQLAIMFRSRVPLLEALRVIADQTKNPDFKEVIFKIAEEVEGGVPFSKALSIYPKLFSSFYISMVKSGEVSGKLSEVLNYLADHLEREYHLSSKIRGAMIYPSMVVLVMLVVLVVMMFFVIPNMVKVFEANEQQLPVVTQFVITITTFIKNQILVFLAGLAFLVVFLMRFIKTPRGKKTIDAMFLKIPLIKDLLKMIYVVRFSENLATLVAGGLPIAQALAIVADIIGHSSYRRVVEETTERVRKGEPISTVLSQFPDLFPPIIVQMVLVGERTGSLDTSLVNIVDFYQKEIDRSIDNVLAVMEPVMIIFLGVVVGGMMLSVLLPLYQSVSI